LPAELRAPVVVIREVLLALLDNAVKFTSRGTITVSLTGDAQRLVFHVQDTGIGLSAEQLEWIGLPFAQVDGGRRRRNTGLGLGLPLARRLATSLGGELKIATPSTGGTNVSFSVLLPASVFG
jgi:signal transduction histidine kinase